jgi:glyoxylase-like metal-dependent hydrolase (beta-lactamase superfamily II)
MLTSITSHCKVNTDYIKEVVMTALHRAGMALLVALAAAGATAHAASPEVLTFRLGMSNVHAIRGDRVVLVDAGGKGDLPALASALARHGIGWSDIAAVVVTHGHSDHAALAAEIRRRGGARLILGRGDAPMAAAGRNDELKPTNFTAKVLERFFIDPSYEPFTADVLVDSPIDLGRYGIEGVVRQVPGHTPGSLVVELPDGRAFVGDVMLGGVMGGRFLADRAGEHYFQADAARNRDNVAELLSRPIATFYLGHGGPVSRSSVVEAFGPAAAERR